MVERADLGVPQEEVEGPDFLLHFGVIEAICHVESVVLTLAGWSLSA